MHPSTNSTSDSYQDVERQYPTCCSIPREGRRLSCLSHRSFAGAAFGRDGGKALHRVKLVFGPQVEKSILREDVRMLGRIATVSATLLLILAHNFSSALSAEPLHYELGFENPSTHLMDVTIRASRSEERRVGKECRS